MAIAKTLSFRLLVIFVAAALVMLLVITLLFSQGIKTEWRKTLRPHLAQYVRYVLADLGDPPSIDRADALAAQLPVDIHIYRSGINQHSTNNEPLNLTALNFSRGIPARAALSKQHNRATISDSKLSLPPLRFANSEHRTIVRISLQEHEVYIDLDRRLHAPGRHRQHLWIVPLTIAALLAVLYLLLRRQLAPIAEIKHGVMRMTEGKLDHRIPIRRNDDLGQLGESVNSMSAQIQQLLDAKRALLLSVSHELRSPITRAHLAAEMLPPSNNRTSLQDDLRLLDKLIEALMESERLQDEHAVLNLSSINFQQLIQDCTNDLQQEFGELVGDVKFNMEDDLNVEIVGDDVRLRLLCRNLLNNAVLHGKSLRTGSSLQQACITITLTTEHEFLVCEIADEGKGVPTEDLSNLIEPFYRPDPSRTHGAGGVGLGLSLAMLIAKAHQGILELNSPTRDGYGFSATIRLPSTAKDV